VNDSAATLFNAKQAWIVHRADKISMFLIIMSIAASKDLAVCNYVKERRGARKHWVENPCFRGSYCLHHQDNESSLLIILMERVSTSETSFSFIHTTTRRSVPQDSHLHSLRRENLKSYLLKTWIRNTLNTARYMCTVILITLWVVRTN
jgi:hypothetical protein